jgi:predicted chitinase
MTLLGTSTTNTIPDSLHPLVNNDLITAEMVRIAGASISNNYLIHILPDMNEYAHAYSIDTNLRTAHFLAQVGHESEFKPTAENLNYSAQRMRQVFGCSGNINGYDANTDDCRVGHHRIRSLLWTNESYYAHSPEHLSNYVYANRVDFNNGSEDSGDGYKYRGRDLIQLTGKSNYQTCTDLHNTKNPEDLQNFVDSPDLIMTNVKYAIESAFIWWYDNHLNNLCTGGTDQIINHVSQRVNGGGIGLIERKTIFHNLMSYMDGH